MRKDRTFSRFEVSINQDFSFRRVFSNERKKVRVQNMGMENEIISRSHVRYNSRLHVIIESIYSKSIHLSLFTAREAVVERSRLVK